MLIQISETRMRYGREFQNGAPRDFLQRDKLFELEISTKLLNHHGDNFTLNIDNTIEVDHCGPF